jgi:hypothetical protein
MKIYAKLLGNYYRTYTISVKESLSHYELKKHKPWFEEEASELLDQRKKSQVDVVTGFKLNEWRYSEQCKM